jgi:hypothetical protein
MVWQTWEVSFATHSVRLFEEEIVSVETSLTGVIDMED